MIFETLYFPKNKDAEYQKRGKNWYKRKKNSKEQFYLVAPDSIQILNDYFKSAPFLYQYSKAAKIGGAILVLAGIVITYRNLYGVQKISK